VPTYKWSPIERDQTPFTCPVCRGAGTVSFPPYVAGDIRVWSSSRLELYECRACQGKGIVWHPAA
jgi:hypothetical protein